MKTIVLLMALAVLGDAAIFYPIRHMWSLKRKDSLGCAVLGERCSEKPCCPYYSPSRFNFGTLHCFQFGVKFCKTDRSIPNRREYFRLVAQLNGTNHREISDRYWLSLKPTPPTPKITRAPSRILRFGR